MSGTRFQSPSLRGSGLFARVDVVQRITEPVSIPFIAGQWSLRWTPPASAEWRTRVSIPFIAGQWSLQGLTSPEAEWVYLFQSPSLRGSGLFLNPLQTLTVAIL